MSNNSKTILGIDVAKRKLDVALVFGEKTLAKQFDNSPQGFKFLSAWLKSLRLTQVHACLEATGTYSEAIALYLFEQGHLVSVVNPFRIKDYATAKLVRNKTDKADARLIADYCQTQNPPLWQPLSPEIQHLQALVRRIEVLQEMLAMEQNRLSVSPKPAEASIHRVIKTFKQEIKQIRKQIKEHLDQHPDLKEQSQLLQSIPGIGEKTAQLLLSEVEFSHYSSARSIAAQAGVTPQKAQSGSSLNATRLSKLGNHRIRKGLYFPAIVAKRYNQTIKEFAKRLEKNGKTKMQIVCAAMRKLLHIAFGVLKHKRPFNPNLAFTG